VTVSDSVLAAEATKAESASEVTRLIIIIIIIIINEKINVAFSRRTARTRNSHKKTQAAKTSCLTVQKKKK